MMRVFILYLLFLFSGSKVSAQSGSFNLNADTLQWTVDSLRDINSDYNRVVTYEFVTYGEENISWKQTVNNVEKQYNFNIQSIAGNWESLLTGEAVVYNVLLDGQGNAGTIRIRKKGVRYEIQFQFPDSSGINTMPLEFSVNQVIKL